MKIRIHSFIPQITYTIFVVCILLLILKRIKISVYTNQMKEILDRLSYMEKLEEKNRILATNFCATYLMSHYKNETIIQMCLESAYQIQPSFLYLRLPHIYHQPHALTPTIIHSKPSDRHVEVVMGMVTVKRNESYIYNTLASLLENLGENELQQILIVVLIADAKDKQAYIQEITKRLLIEFPKSMSDGLIELVSPNDNFYPPLSNQTTLGDSIERTRWRTKQNLDYIYLMSYCRNKGRYYLHLEDDIVAGEKYLSQILRFTQKHKHWFVIEFSPMGFIGKLFHQESLSKIIVFLTMFYDDKPGDWLLDHYKAIISPCTVFFTCKTTKYRIKSPLTLFQHVGVTSSLKGKIQKLKDKYFRGKTDYFSKVPSKNPEAVVESSMHHISEYSLQQVYDFNSHSNTFNSVSSSDLKPNNITITFARYIHAISISVLVVKECTMLFNESNVEIGYLDQSVINHHKKLRIIDYALDPPLFKEQEYKTWISWKIPNNITLKYVHFIFTFPIEFLKIYQFNIKE